MGSIVAQDVFQRKLDAIFLDVPGVTGIADDMIIYGWWDLASDSDFSFRFSFGGIATFL